MIGGMEIDVVQWIILFFGTAAAGWVDAVIGGGGLILIPMLLAGGWAWLNLGVLQRYLPTGASFGRIFDNLAPPSRAASPYPVSIVNQVTFGVPAAALLLVGCFAVLTVLRLRTRLAIGLTAAAASPAAPPASTPVFQSTP